MDILIGIGIFVVAFILGGAYGWGLRERVAMRIVDEALKHVENTQVKKDMIPIVVEKHEDRLFIYHKDNHEFMAQGSTMAELNDALEKRYPGKKFSCSEEHLEAIKALS
jgi:LytS/YehU family sensor histidine kinase